MPRPNGRRAHGSLDPPETRSELDFGVAAPRDDLAPAATQRMLKMANFNSFLSTNHLEVGWRRTPLAGGAGTWILVRVDLISPSQIRAARVLLGWTQRELAEAAKLSLNAVARLEQEKGDPRVGTLTKIARALEQGGIEFLPQSEGKGPGLRLKRGSKGH